MIPYPVYKLIHILGILMIFLSLGGQINHAINGASKTDNAWRKASSITHGIGLVLVLLGGFGMLARIDIDWPWPAWVFGKIVIWLLLGGLVAVVNRKPEAGRGMWYVVLLLGFLAAYFALMKPF